MNNVLAGLLGTQALDEEGNSFLVVAVDTESQYVFLVDSRGDSYMYDFTDLKFPQLASLVAPAPIRAVETEEEEQPVKKGWL